MKKMIMMKYLRYMMFLLCIPLSSLYSQQDFNNYKLLEEQDFSTAIVISGYDKDTLSFDKFMDSSQWTIDDKSYEPADTVISKELGIAFIYPAKYSISKKANSIIELSNKGNGTINNVLTISLKNASFDSLAQQEGFHRSDSGDWEVETQGGMMSVFEIVGKTFHCLYDAHQIRVYDDNGYVGMGESEIDFFYVIKTYDNRIINFSNHGLSANELYFIFSRIRLFH